MRLDEAWVWGVAVAVLTPGYALAEPNWEAMLYTLHEDYQAVDANGAGTFPVTNPVKMRGVLLSRPQDVLDMTPGADPFMGGQWQIFVQAVDLPDTADDDNTFGGTACWMGQNIGRIVGDHPAGSYTDQEWLDELDRLNHDPTTGHWFRPGDLIELRARAPGLFYKGKTNINEQHSNNPLLNFDVVLLQASFGPQTPELITLSDVKDGDDDFIFDQTRATGAEHHQGTAVKIEDVSFVSTANWGHDGDLTITDGTKTLPVKLGQGGGFSEFNAPTGTFDIVGIFDQEDGDGSNGYKHGYRLYVMDYDGTNFVLVRYARADFDKDGDVDDMDFDHLGACSSGPTVPQTDPSCQDADLDGDSDVDMSDFGIFQRCIAGADNPADPACAG